MTLLLWMAHVPIIPWFRMPRSPARKTTRLVDFLILGQLRQTESFVPIRSHGEKLPVTVPMPNDKTLLPLERRVRGSTQVLLDAFHNPPARQLHRRETLSVMSLRHGTHQEQRLQDPRPRNDGIPAVTLGLPVQCTAYPPFEPLTLLLMHFVVVASSAGVDVREEAALVVDGEVDAHAGPDAGCADVLDGV